MNQINPPHSGWPPADGVVELIRIGEREPFATAHIDEIDGPWVALRGCRAAISGQRVEVRWWDESDTAWIGRGFVDRSDPASETLSVALETPWRMVLLRRAARIGASHEVVELLTFGGDGRVIRRTRALCLDLSPLGCRISGAGQPPLAEEVVHLANPRARAAVIDARVVRCDATAFGGWDAGLEFLPRTAADREALMAWRDLAANELPPS